MMQRTRRRNDLENDLRKAIVLENLYLVCQPVVRMDTVGSKLWCAGSTLSSDRYRPSNLLALPNTLVRSAPGAKLSSVVLRDSLSDGETDTLTVAQFARGQPVPGPATVSVSDGWH